MNGKKKKKKLNRYQIRQLCAAVLVLGLLCVALSLLLGRCSEEKPVSQGARPAESSETVDSDSTNASEAPTEPIPTDTEPPTEEPTEQASAEPEGEVTAIELTVYSLTLKAGQSQMPIVTMLPAEAADKSELWESSDPSVATVSTNGTITGVSEGSCTVTVTSVDSPSVSASVSVTVEPAEAGASVTEPTYIQGILIANKTYGLPADYAPGVNAEASAAFASMADAAAKAGLNLYISSGYRSYDYQSQIYQNYCNLYGQAEADTFSARPGHSEHQTGLAFDLNTIDDSFADTAEYPWVCEHAHEYGFIIRYPEGKESITGYQFEPWHLRYLGTEVAEKVYESGLTLEEYLGITSQYAE